MFTAGIDTSTIIVEWAMAEMLKNSTILNRAQVELDDVVDRDHDRLLEETDLSKLAVGGMQGGDAAAPPLVFNPDRFITGKGARSAYGSTECVHRQQRRPRYQRPRPCTRPVTRAAAASGGRSLVCHVKRPRHAVVVVRKRRPRAGLPQVAVATRPDAAQTDAGRHEQVTWPCKPQPCVGGRTSRSRVLVTAHAPAATVGEEIRVRAFLQ
ncbi:hypothetical protein GW17_00057189 [Ensete ventricosum]|nr:hypothetical protein GW17_00057189 [Ensete ventricosum]